MPVARETFPYAKNKNPSSTIWQIGYRNEQEQQSTVRSALPNHFPLAKRYSDSPWYIQRRFQVHSNIDWNHLSVRRMGEAGREKPWSQRRSIQTVQDAWKRQ